MNTTRQKDRVGLAPIFVNHTIRTPASQWAHPPESRSSSPSRSFVSTAFWPATGELQHKSPSVTSRHHDEQVSFPSNESSSCEDRAATDDTETVASVRHPRSLPIVQTVQRRESATPARRGGRRFAGGRPVGTPQNLHPKRQPPHLGEAAFAPERVFRGFATSFPGNLKITVSMDSRWTYNICTCEICTYKIHTCKFGICRKRTVSGPEVASQVRSVERTNRCDVPSGDRARRRRAGAGA